jgi:hypothetical protein
MNTSGKVKILVLLILAILFLVLYTIPPSKTDVFFPSLSAFVAGFVGVFLKSLLSTGISKERYNRPSWNDKFFRSSNPLSNYVFVSSIFIVIGFCALIKTEIVFQGTNLMGVVSLSFGISILLATYLTYFLFKSSGNIIGKWKREGNPSGDKELGDTNYNWANIMFNSDTTFSIGANNDEKYLGVSLAEWHGGKDLKGKWRIEKHRLFLKSEGLPTNFLLIYEIIQLTSNKLILLSSLAKGDPTKHITYSRNK